MFEEPYLDLGKEIAKSRRQKVSNFALKQQAVRIIYLAIAHCPTSFGKGGTIQKIRKFDGLPRTHGKG